MTEERSGATDEEAHGRLAEALAARREKLERLRGGGIEPFALEFEPTASLSEIRERFAAMKPNQVAEERFSVAGRIVLLRKHGQLSFATIRDASADLQLFLSADDLAESFPLIDALDLGDIVGADGRVMTTR